METIRVRRQQSNKPDRNVLARKLGRSAASDPRQKFKKSYIDEKYGVEEAEKKYAEWDKLMQQLFVRRK
jgi:hypothetical protein